MDINFSAGVEYENKIYFSAWEFNAFCSMDIKTGIVEFLSFFEKEKMVPRLYADAFLYEDSIWFMPCVASHIVCVDLRTLKKTYFFVENKQSAPYSTNGSYFAYSQQVYDGSYHVYYIPARIDTLAVVDLKNKNVDFIPAFTDVNEMINGNKTRSGIIIDNVLYCFTYEFFGEGINSYEKYSIYTQELISVEWPYGKEIRGLPFFLGNEIAFVPWNTHSFWHINYANMTCCSEKLSHDVNFFSSYIDIGSEIVFLPFSSNFFLVLNKNTNKIFEFTPEEKWCFSEEYSSIKAIYSHSGLRIAVIGDKSAIILFGKAFNDISFLKMKKEKFYGAFYEAVAQNGEYFNKLIAGSVLYEIELDLKYYLNICMKL